MIVLSLALLLASLVAGFAGFALLITPAVGAEGLLWPPAGMVPAFLLFVVAAVLFSAGAVVEALRILRKDLRALVGRAAIVLALLSLTGCATAAPQLSQAEWVALKTRTYPGVTSTQVVAAAEQLFRLADGSDFRLSYQADGSGMKATRSWLLHLVISGTFGTEEWTLKVADRPDGAWIGVDVAGSMGMIMWGIIPGPSHPRTDFESPALFDLFWARMNHLLGRSKEWRTCDMQSARVDAKATWGTLDPLCWAADDTAPEGAKVTVPAALPVSR